MGSKKMIDKVYPILKKGKLVYFPFLFCYLELLLHLYAFRSFSSSIFWIVAFALGIGFFFSFLTSVFPQKVNGVLTYVLSFLVTLIYEIQLVYFQIFKGFAPVSSIKLGGQAITNFAGGALEGVRTALWMILVLLIPFVLLCVIGIWKRVKFRRLAKWYSVIPLGISVIVLSGTVGIMALFFSGSPSLYGLFSSSETSTDVSVSNFGLTVTMFQECRWMVLPDSEKEPVEELNEQTYGEEYQVDPTIDFKELHDKADSEDLRNLTAALSNMPVSKKNQYTGICEGYNLIAICAEAFSPEFIDPELTPTLYKLANNGFVFENFYSAFPNTTTNGEYAFCMGLWPDLSRGKTDSSFGLSSSNYLPYAYGNLFRSIGGQAKAYHNYTAEFYHRDYTHTNMGYDFLAGNSGLDIEVTWPSSDYDMMVASVDDYIDSGEQFVAYYMTFSGHYQYTLENAMSAKNWDAVKDLDYSDAVKAYIACNLELEKALTYLMERLEDAGIADKTAIVLTTDHYPYGLTDAEYAELSGREINDSFDKQKNSFICYVPNMEPVHVSDYCSSIDILPTILNLFGFTYDSRLLAGQDVLADNIDHVAILADGSFITDGIYYDATQASFQYDGDAADAQERATRIYNAVDKKFRISTQILNNDYYAFAYDFVSDGQAIVDPTTQYLDVEIMAQAATYYVLTHDLMEPFTDERFGLTDDYTIAELLDVAYRLAGRPDITIGNTPFTAPEKYLEAVAWCYQNGILREDGLVPYDLDQAVNVGQACLIYTRASAYLGVDTSVDDALVWEAMYSYPELNEEVIRASMFCRDHTVIVGNGEYEYVFYSSANTVNRHFGVNATYKLCTYLLSEYFES